LTYFSCHIETEGLHQVTGSYVHCKLVLFPLTGIETVKQHKSKGNRMEVTWYGIE